MIRKFSSENSKKNKQEEIDIDKIVSENVQQLNLKNKKYEKEIKRKWVHMLRKNVESYGKASIGNRVTIFNEGVSAYSDMIKEIDRSKKRVWIETYIFDDSKLAECLVNKLCDASSRGCDVILLIDYIGSLKIKSSWIKKMKQHQVHIVLFNSFLDSIKHTLPIFFRDHRKIMILDDCAYCGSMNVSENVVGEEVKWSSLDELKKKELEIGSGSSINNGSYSSGDKTKTLQYYDLHVKVKGPAIEHLAEVFLDSLKESKSGLVRKPIESQKCNETEDACFVQILESNVLRKKRSIQKVFEQIIRNATDEIYITTSYFLPPGFLRRSLYHALGKGVDISFLFSGNSDVYGDVPSTYHIIRKFLRRSGEKYEPKGIYEEDEFIEKKNSRNIFRFLWNQIFVYQNRILFFNLWNSQNVSTLRSFKERMRGNKKKGRNHFYFLQKKHCHAKNMVVDNLWSVTGSFNWDRYSSRRNLEVMISVFDKKIADQFIQEHKNKIQNNSTPITLSHLSSRNKFQLLMSYCAYHIGRCTGKNIFDGLSNHSKKTILRKAIINQYLKDNLIENVVTGMMLTM